MLDEETSTPAVYLKYFIVNEHFSKHRSRALSHFLI